MSRRLPKRQANEAMTIKIFNLCCANGHVFEGWFPSNDEFERQKAAGEIACPQCGSIEVEKRPSASRISHAKMSKKEREEFQAACERLMAAVRDEAAKAEDVGRNFVQESRNIAAGISENRTIKGQCTPEEARELLEEGIAVLPVPESSGKTIN